ncbi:MAG: hypothetical protein IPJ36_11855 [Simplicispira sp.]|nr:hypothetical protein [Simplicispira sp.]
MRLLVEQHNLFAKLTPLRKAHRARAAAPPAAHIVGFSWATASLTRAGAARCRHRHQRGQRRATERPPTSSCWKSLMVLEEGVLEGRKTFSNMLKRIRMTASSNFGNVFSVLSGQCVFAVPPDAAAAVAGAEPAV